MAVCAIFARLRWAPAFPVTVAFRAVAGGIPVRAADVAEFLPRSHGEPLGRRHAELPPIWRPWLLWAPRWGISAAAATSRPMADWWLNSCAGASPESLPTSEAGFPFGTAGLSPALCARFSPVRSGDRPVVATRRRCRCGPPVAFRRWSPDARILALEPLCGPFRLPGQGFPSGPSGSLSAALRAIFRRCPATARRFRPSAGFLRLAAAAGSGAGRRAAVRLFGLEFSKNREIRFCGRP